jgi:hypothetical protein
MYACTGSSLNWYSLLNKSYPYNVTIFAWMNVVKPLYIHFTVHRNGFLLNNQPDAPIIQIYSLIKLYMFRASSMPIIRSFLLYIRHWHNIFWEILDERIFKPHVRRARRLHYNISQRATIYFEKLNYTTRNSDAYLPTVNSR